MKRSRNASLSLRFPKSSRFYAPTAPMKRLPGGTKTRLERMVFEAAVSFEPVLRLVGTEMVNYKELRDVLSDSLSPETI